MDELKRARTKATVRRKDMLSSIEAVRSRLTLPQLADDALSLLDPELSLPRRVKATVTSQPLAVTFLLGAAGWLLFQKDEPRPPARIRNTVKKINQRRRP